MPLAGDVFQRVLAAVVECHARSGDEVDDGTRDEDFSRRGPGGNPRADVYRYPADAIAHQLDLAGVQPCPDLDSQRAHTVTYRQGTRNGPPGAIERGQEPVSGGVDLTSAMTAEFFSHQPMVLVENLVPSPVPHRRCCLRRSDDVGKQDRCEHPVGVDGRAAAGNELLDLGDDAVGVAEEGDVVNAVKPDKPGCGNASRNRASLPGIDDPVTASVQDQSGYLDMGQDTPDVDLAEYLGQFPPLSG